MELHHIGVATPDADAAVDRLTAVLDVPVAHTEETNGLDIRFLDLGDGYLEVLEPLEEGPVARYLEREGEGVHHIGLHTDDIDASLHQAAAAGVELIDEEPRPGAWGHDIAFLHPSDTAGVLIEFVATDQP